MKLEGSHTFTKYTLTDNIIVAAHLYCKNIFSSWEGYKTINIWEVGKFLLAHL